MRSRSPSTSVKTLNQFVNVDRGLTSGFVDHSTLSVCRKAPTAVSILKHGRELFMESWVTNRLQSIRGDVFRFAQYEASRIGSISMWEFCRDAALLLRITS